ncbi:MAG: tetratricopeptide repeat protein [Hyphomicrobiales bacterium]
MKHFAVLLAAALIAMSGAGLAQSLDQLSFAKKLKLAKVGDEEAQVAVALAYETGSETALDTAEAAKWYRQAALQGNVEAQFRLARIVGKGARGLKQDYPTAIKLYEAAAGNGHSQAMNALGLMHQSGEGVAADPAKAAEWYRKAAEAKLADAENNLGILYLNGKGVPRDLGEALKLFERAANQGDGWGLNNLGGMHEMGWGTPKDRDKAIDLYKQAAAKGIAAARENLERLTATP